MQFLNIVFIKVSKSKLRNSNGHCYGKCGAPQNTDRVFRTLTTRYKQIPTPAPARGFPGSHTLRAWPGDSHILIIKQVYRVVRINLVLLQETKWDDISEETLICDQLSMWHYVAINKLSPFKSGTLFRNNI